MNIKAAINGGTPKSAHAAVPVTPEEIAHDVVAVAAAGAFAVHCHPRDDEGRESLEARHVDAVVRAVRSRTNAIAIGVTTGAWIVPDPAARLATIQRWTALPDFASVNFDEAGAEDVARYFLEHGVGVEAGLATAAGAMLYAQSVAAGRCVRILLEPQETDVDAARENVKRMERVLDDAVDHTPRLLHGMGETVWPMLRLAMTRGYDSRIGFEDTIFLDDGSIAESNAALVRAAINATRA
jgi:uncharacterized protein (DUF849 family)